MPTSGQPRLLVEERRRKILDLVEKQARVTVEELVHRFGVSAVTVRGDLDALSTRCRTCRSTSRRRCITARRSASATPPPR
jgi:predicted ArsR family transcriptional regulator